MWTSNRLLTLVGFCAGASVGLHAAQQAGDLRSLPGDAGPRVEIVGQPPNGNEVVDIFVYEMAEQAAVGATRPQRFPRGVGKLNLDLRLKNMPYTGVRVHFDVLTTGGALEMADGFVSIVRLATQGVASMEFDLRPKNGPFPDGPYQLRLSMNEQPLAVLNWSVGGP